MKKSLAVPTFLERLSFPKYLSHFVLSGTLLLLVLLWLYSDDLSRLITPNTQSIAVQCDIQRPPHQCLIPTATGLIQLTSASAIQSLEPFSVKLQTATGALSSAKIRFEGFNDYMGINQFRFRQDSTNHWAASGSIPLCTTKSKTWKVIVSVYNGTNYHSYWFKMQTK